jgi:hypothetical protein
MSPVGDCAKAIVAKPQTRAKVSRHTNLLSVFKILLPDGLAAGNGYRKAQPFIEDLGNVRRTRVRAGTTGCKAMKHVWFLLDSA